MIAQPRCDLVLRRRLHVEAEYHVVAVEPTNAHRGHHAHQAQRRLGLDQLLSVFGLLALVLSAVGIAGVVAYAVSRQARDIGVRVALGATKVSVLTGISRGMVLPVLLGLGVGVLMARSLSRLVEGFMFGVTATDPLTYGLISLSVLAVAVAATLLPARRATRVNPVEVLRAD